MESARPLLSVSTILTPLERARVDAAGAGAYRTIHREGIGEIVKDIKNNRASAVIVSIARCGRPMHQGISAMVREFPSVATVALVSSSAPDDSSVALSLGTSGIHRLVDVRDPSGWSELRQVLLTERGGEIEREALAALGIDLAGAEPDCWRFFETMFSAPTRVSTVRALCRVLAVLPSTLMSRFYRAGLPAPKRYLALARLMRAARLFENSGFSVSNVANHMDYSSPQSFGRHVRSMLGVTAGEFRRRFDGAGMLRYYRETMILPHLAELKRLTPLGGIETGEFRARKGPAGRGALSFEL
jgi:AraC-like DNA-binding protein